MPFFEKNETVRIVKKSDYTLLKIIYYQIYEQYYFVYHTNLFCLATLQGIYWRFVNMRSILLVDDGRWDRMAIKRKIERTGLPFMILHECSNGLEALDWLKLNSVDLILSEIRMPVMDGLTLMNQINTMRLKIPIIIISSYDDFYYVKQSLRAGVLDYLLKPVEVWEMKSCLENYMKLNVKSHEKAPKKDPLEMSLVEQVIEFIKSKPPGEITLAETAAAVHLNPSYLSQLFKQRMSQTFLDYVLQLRMDEAEWLLVHTSLKISEIAMRLGYADLSYFSNAFKRIKRKSPSEYRKLYQKATGT